MNRNARLINNSLKLREPQKDSLEVFEAICDKLELTKDAELINELQKIKSVCPTIEDFEREFPSICFSLATGVGKTRLMGAFIAYLYYEKGIKNFFVMAPNLTIYNKLKVDFGNISNPKYVFKGLDAFVNPPRIIDGENYEEFRQSTFGYSDITINIFNISKLNAETKGKVGKPARIKRLNEVLGESYFEYLVNLSDLVLLMDESHHYRADRGMTVINELKPILGIEVTATPQVQKGARTIKFKNVVYEYSLAHALEDGKFIKVPAVATRENFMPEQYTEEQLDKIKLQDGIKIHIDTQSAIEIYARQNGKRIVKPFVLVVAKDTTHSAVIKEYLTSNDFFKGYYKNKVLEINSAQKGSEKDENIAQLLTLEEPDNKIEIVIHVNMLKEGWDVSNLYTLIPLRASASETLTEQTIGRGLRLPYGERTGDERVDMLTIVSHDKYKAIIDLANEPNSMVRKVYCIDPEENKNEEQKTTVELPSKIEEEIDSYSFTKQLSTHLSDEVIVEEHKKSEVSSFISQNTYKAVMEINKRVKNINDINTEEVKKLIINSVISNTSNAFSELKLSKQDIIACVEEAVEQVIQLVTNIIIPIPQAIIQPVLQIKEGFYEFSLNTSNINFQPSDETIKRKDLTKDGNVSYIDLSFAEIKDSDTLENSIVRELLLYSNIDYEECADLMFSLVEQLKNHLKSYLKSDSDVEKVLKQRRKDIVEIIYSQMNEHFYKEETCFKAVDMRPFSKIEVGFGESFKSDKIYDFRVTIPPAEVKSRIFKGFKKSCHTMYKFKNNTEKTFAIILEDDTDVIKWMCPNIKQFNIYYDKFSTSRYQPDFIVETVDSIYMVETKDSRMLEDEVVKNKARAAIEYCKSATEFNMQNGGKPWKYALIPHEVVKDNMSFNWLIKNYIKDKV